MRGSTSGKRIHTSASQVCLVSGEQDPPPEKRGITISESWAPQSCWAKCGAVRSEAEQPRRWKSPAYLFHSLQTCSAAIVAVARRFIIAPDDDVTTNSRPRLCVCGTDIYIYCSRGPLSFQLGLKVDLNHQLTPPTVQALWYRGQLIK